MLVPRRVKFRKQMRGTRTGTASRGTSLTNGDFGLQSLQAAWVSAQQIEAARRAITHFIARGGKVWIKVFPDKPITKKPPETRMGSGKGDVYAYVAVVKPGRVLFEMGGVSRQVAYAALRLAAYKLPVKTKVIEKGQIV